MTRGLALACALALAMACGSSSSDVPAAPACMPSGNALADASFDGLRADGNPSAIRLADTACDQPLVVRVVASFCGTCRAAERSRSEALASSHEDEGGHRARSRPLDGDGGRASSARARHRSPHHDRARGSERSRARGRRECGRSAAHDRGDDDERRAPADPTNRFADDPTAAVLGSTLFLN